MPAISNKAATIDNIEAAETIARCLVSPNLLDNNYEPANVVDALGHIADGAKNVALAIASNETTMCLTEAVIDLAAAVNRIADAIEMIAEAISSKNP